MRIFVRFALLLVSISIYGQTYPIKPTIDERYPGGEDALLKFISTHAKFPGSAAEAWRMGLSIASITITPYGIIDNAAIHNSLGEDIDREVANVLYLTGGQWLPAEGYARNQTFYFQLSFDLNESTDDKYITVHGDTILNELKFSLFHYSASAYTSNKSLKKNLDRAIKKESYDKALGILDEFIRRDPFNVRYYELQAMCYEGLDRIAKKAEVERRIQECYTNNLLSLLEKPVLYGNITIIDTLENGTFSIKELNRDSTIIYSGRLASIRPEIRQGKYYFFDQEGKISATGEYLDDIPVGTWNYYNSDGQIIHSLDYSAVVKFLLEDEKNPISDTAFHGRNDIPRNLDGTFYVAEVMPLFNGGDPAKEFPNYISRELTYPVFARIKGIEGRVIIQFTIDKQGKVREPVVVSGVQTDLNMEVLRIIINSPDWTPGKIEGRNVNIVYTFPVNFRISGG